MSSNLSYNLLVTWLLFSTTSIPAQHTPQVKTHFVTKDTIAIASEPDYPPYCFIEKNGEASGFSVDLFNVSAKATGLQVKIKIGIWNKIMLDLANGAIDALPMVGRTPERKDLFDFTMPYMSLHGAVFVRKGTTGIHSINDLKEKSIVVMEGDNAEEFVRRENISNHVVTTKTFEEAFLALANGNHDAVITQRIMGIELLKNLGITNVKPLDFHLPQFRQDFCFAVRKGDTVLLSRLNEGLSIIIANDTYEQIRQKWFGPRFKEKIAFTDILRILLYFVVPLIIIISLIAIFLLRKEVKRQTRDLHQEITGHKETLKALQTSEEKYRGMIFNLMEGFYNVTLDGILIDHNIEFARILKLDPQKDHSGISLPDFWEDPGERKSYITEIITRGFIRNYEIHAKQSDGTKIVVQASSRIVNDEQGNPVSIEGSFLDITKRKQAEQELIHVKNGLEKTIAERTALLQEKVEKLHKSEQAMLYMIEDLNRINAELKEERQKLKLSNQELEAFTYSVSHDLRAPLRAIDGYGNFLMEDYAGKLDSEGKRFIGVMRDNATKMDKLISDLLNLSRISRVGMNLILTDLTSIAESMYHEIATNEEKKTFDFHIQTMPPAFCDVTLIKLVWQNLIGNALKYSGKSKTKKIGIKAKEREDEIIYSVKDSGVGFNNVYVDKLFSVFQRLHSDTEFPGTGVGLAIVKRIIQRHGGTVWADGTLGKGATFYFTLPRK